MRRSVKLFLYVLGFIAVCFLILDLATQSWTALVGDLVILAVVGAMVAAVVFVLRKRRRNAR